MKPVISLLVAALALVAPAANAALSVPEVVQNYMRLNPKPDGASLEKASGLYRYVWLQASKDLKASGVVFYVNPKDPQAWGIVLADAKRTPSDYVGTTNLKHLGSPDGGSDYSLVRAGRFQNALLIVSAPGLAGERVVTVCTYPFLKLTAPGAANWVVQNNK